jgi:hypothetical protein
MVWVLQAQQSKCLWKRRRHLLSRPVIEFCGTAVDTAGDALKGFKGVVIFQKRGK